MITAINELKKIHCSMANLLIELEFLEDGVDADYSQVVIDYNWLVHVLKIRRDYLKERQGVEME